MTLKFYVNNKALTTLTYTPQLNGVVEINNQTILDMARCLLKAKKLPKQYWAGVISCVMYLLSMPNQKSVGCLSRKTMEWSQNKWYSSSSLFLCGLCKDPEARMTKHDDKNEKCIFVGYGDRKMEFKLYNLITKKVIMSRDVILKKI
jgi:hypothetical protein